MTTTWPKVEVYKDEAGEWRWKKRSRNGKVTGASEEGYKRRGYCVRRAGEENPGLDVSVTE